MAYIDLVNITLAKQLTGIDDENLLSFYVEAICRKIEKFIGYPLAKTQRVDYLNGVNSCNLWLQRKPVTMINSVKNGGSLIPDTDYELRDAEYTPSLRFDYVIPKCEELEVDNEAGYDILPYDLQALLFDLINDFQSEMQNKGLSSYKISDISYTYRSYLDNENKFFSKIIDSFGIYT